MPDPKDHTSTGPIDPAEGADLETSEMKPPAEGEASEKKAPTDDKGMGDGVPRTYASESEEGKEKTSFGGPQGGD